MAAGPSVDGTQRSLPCKIAEDNERTSEEAATKQSPVIASASDASATAYGCGPCAGEVADDQPHLESQMDTVSMFHYVQDLINAQEVWCENKLELLDGTHKQVVNDLVNMGHMRQQGRQQEVRDPATPSTTDLSNESRGQVTHASSSSLVDGEASCHGPRVSHVAAVGAEPNRIQAIRSWSELGDIMKKAIRENWRLGERNQQLKQECEDLRKDYERREKEIKEIKHRSGGASSSSEMSLSPSAASLKDSAPSIDLIGASSATTASPPPERLSRGIPDAGLIPSEADAMEVDWISAVSASASGERPATVAAATGGAPVGAAADGCEAVTAPESGAAWTATSASPQVDDALAAGTVEPPLPSVNGISCSDENKAPRCPVEDFAGAQLSALDAQRSARQKESGGGQGQSQPQTRQLTLEEQERMRQQLIVERSQQQPSVPSQAPPQAQPQAQQPHTLPPVQEQSVLAPDRIALGIGTPVEGSTPRHRQEPSPGVGDHKDGELT